MGNSLDSVQMARSFKSFGAVMDGVTSDTAAWNTAMADIPVGGALVIPPGTALGTFKVRRSSITLIFQGTVLKHPAGAADNVLELGDCASGNAAVAYEKINIVGQVLIDGNKANVVAPGSDVVGWGFCATKISNSDWGTGIRAKDCHNGGFGAFINSNYNKASVYVENCGNVTVTGPGFDINSSKYNVIDFISKGCYDGGRVLDNCFGNVIRGTVKDPTRNGFTYNNQQVNESYGNDLSVTVEGGTGNGWSVGVNCHDSNIVATVKGAGDSAMQIPLQTIITNTFDGSSGAVVSAANDTITIAAHGLSTGYKVMYNPGTGGTAIGGATGGETYYAIRVDANTVKLATSQDNAGAGVAINITGVGVGVTHSLVYNPRARGNTITLNTERNSGAAILLGGDDNTITVNSNQDGRNGASGSFFAVDVYGDRNTLTIQHMDSNPWQVRGVAFRAGATDNLLLGITYDNTADVISDLGTRTRYNRGEGQGADITAANTITIPPVGNVFHIVGNTGIATISGSNAKGRITFIFDGTPTFTDGSNLKLAGNLVATADDTITGWWDGTNFYELARSVN